MRYDLNGDGSQKFRGSDCSDTALVWSACGPELRKSTYFKSLSPELQAKHLEEIRKFEATQKRKR